MLYIASAVYNKSLNKGSLCHVETVGSPYRHTSFANQTGSVNLKTNNHIAA